MPNTLIQWNRTQQIHHSRFFKTLHTDLQGYWRWISTFKIPNSRPEAYDGRSNLQNLCIQGDDTVQYGQVLGLDESTYGWLDGGDWNEIDLITLSDVEEMGQISTRPRAFEERGKDGAKEEGDKSRKPISWISLPWRRLNLLLSFFLSSNSPASWSLLSGSYYPHKCH